MRYDAGPKKYSITGQSLNFQGNYNPFQEKSTNILKVMKQCKR